MKKNNVLRWFYSNYTINRLESKIKLFGMKYNYNINKILLSRLIYTILVLIASIIVFKNNIFFILITVVGFYFISEYLFFDYRLKKRAKVLEKDAIFYFQILSLTLESGNNLKNGIELTSKNITSDLSLEFKKVIEDISMGKSLTEALNDLKTRIPSDAVGNIVLNLMESNIYGSNMIESLNTQLDYLNDKQLLGVKERINKMPIKISILSVVIFIPLILLIILGPLLIQLIAS